MSLKRSFNTISLIKFKNFASSISINEAVEFFFKFENIKGYKIPSRGRNALKLLSYTKKDSVKDYKTALYI